jgi:membrane protease YdiL (CAAX protease family)
MQFPGPVSLAYLVYLLAFLPWAALRSKKRLVLSPQSSDSGTRLSISRTRAFATTLFSLVVLYLVTDYTGRGFGFEIFHAPTLGERSFVAAEAAFAVCLALILLNRALRSPEERQTMAVYAMMPRTGREWVLFVLVSCAAGIAEEAAYRGVLVAVLTYTLGSVWPAVFLSAAAFAVVHAFQGWKSGVVIFGIALTMHALVDFTDTLVFAMGVHVILDLFVGILGSWRLRRGQVEG